MPDALTTITKLIQSPPGQLAAGGVLAGIVWKFFERVEAVLTDQTKLEIAVWLVGVDTAKPPRAFQEMLTKGFDHIFGRRQASWHCAVATSILTITLSVLVSPFITQRWYPCLITECPSVAKTALAMSLILFFAFYLFIHCMRNGVHNIISSTEVGQMTKHYLRACLQSLLSVLIVLFMSQVVSHLIGYPNSRFPDYGTEELGTDAYFIVVLCVAFGIPSVLILFLASAFGVKAAARFHIGFDWFNRKFDIEKKPLQSIGLVAGALVAVVYWMAVIVSRVVR